MALGASYVIIWGDTHIGTEDNNRDLKKHFAYGVAQVAALPPLPPDPINDIILAVPEVSGPILFANTLDTTLKHIEQQNRLGKKIILITSATLGRLVIPDVVSGKIPIETYYVFCGNIAQHCDFGNQCIEDGINIGMFDHQLTLLIRLCRDMSEILAKEGEDLFNNGNFKSALRYFKFAHQIANKGVENDTRTGATDNHLPFRAHLTKLERLVEKAGEALSQQSSN